MQKQSHHSYSFGLLLAGALSMTGVAVAQKALSDAQVEANVLRALAGAPQLATQSIKTTTVYGTVTLSGSVADEASRSLAETLASKSPGVQKVVDELTLGGNSSADSNAATNSSGSGSASMPPQPAQQDDAQIQGSNPQLQSDGTVAPPDNAQSQQPQPPSAQPTDGQGPQQNANGQYPNGQYPSNQGQQQYPQGQPYPNDGSDQAGPGAPPTYRRPYRPAPQPNYGYGQQPPPYQGYGQPAPPPYGAQEAGKPVTIAAGSLVRMRINEGLSSKRVQPGAVFDGTVLNDVVADGEVAIPRGATVQGTIVESKDSGAVGGRGQLALQLTSVTLSGKSYPIASDLWTHDGRDNTGRTVQNAVGLGAFGAIIGAVAGGGAGAAIGAVAGGAAGVGVSAAQGRGQVVVPAEAILSFHLTQPAGVVTVSQAEMERLGYGVQQSRMVRRPPPPPPGYYGRPAYYPYSY